MPVGAADLSQLKLLLSSDSRRPAPAPAARPAPVRPGQFARPSQFSSTRSEKEWGRYLNVSSAAEMVLRMLPAPGRAEYRKLYGQAAGRLLRQYEENGDPGIIRQVSHLCRSHAFRVDNGHHRGTKRHRASRGQRPAQRW